MHKRDFVLTEAEREDDRLVDNLKKINEDINENAHTHSNKSFCISIVKAYPEFSSGQKQQTIHS